MPEISVIIAVYNVKQYLQRCVKSVINQTFSNIEIILVDDGSTDGSGILCDEFAIKDSRIRVIHQSNKGLSAARNAGLDIAIGEYISFIDGDDWVSKYFLERLWLLLKNTDYRMSSCAYQLVKKDIVKEKKNDIKNVEMNKKESHEWFLKGIIYGRGNDASCCTKLYKREVFKNRKFMEGIFYEDVLMNWEIINIIDGYIYTNEQLYYYYMREISISRGGFKDKDFDLLIGAKRIIKSISEQDKKLYELAIQYFYKCYFSIFIKMLCGKNVPIEQFKKVVRTVKKGYRYLIMSPMPFRKKIVVCIIEILPECLLGRIVRLERG